ncbi:MAG TPA: hypothetical protein DDY20_10435 [Desulfobulbaceae bacterium]|nr:hypothetical protein [Desulfobulbaceae bacterium]
MEGRGPLLFLLLLLLTYLVIGCGFARLTPDWQNPDEPAHYNYIRQLAETLRLPVLRMNDYDQAYLEEAVRQGFPPDPGLALLRYENHQPPLFYLLSQPVYSLGGKRVLSLRFFSLLLGSGVIVLAYLVGRTVVPGRPYVACCAAAFVALLPQHTAMMASINNDALAGLLMALVLWLSLRERLRLSAGLPERALLGLAVGLGLLTKLTVAIGYPVAAFALLRRLGEDRAPPFRDGRTLPPASARWADLLLVLVLPLLLALPWWLRNLSVYGWPDFLGLIRHASVVAAQPQTVDWITAQGLAAWLHRLSVFTFQSFWGQFGWMAVPMQPVVYRVLLAFCGLLAAGWFFGRLRGGRRACAARGATELLLYSLALTLLAYLGYNCSFVQHQGRYLFSGLVPISLAVAFGWDGLAGRTGEHRPVLSLLVLYGLLLLLDLYALFGVLRPHEW